MSERGDTLVEILIAVSLLAMVTVGTSRIMSVGHTLALEGLEHSEVQSHIGSQLSVLRYMRDEYLRSSGGATSPGARDWKMLVDGGYLDTSPIDTATCGAKRHAFWLRDDLTAADVEAQVVVVPYTAGATSGIATPGSGVWVEARYNAASKAVDFVAKACWDSVSDGPRQEAKSTVRLLTP